MTEKNLEERLYKFALNIINFVRALPKEMVVQEIGKQLLRAGTSIAANYEEAKGAFSKGDFAYKMSISFKEARETNLWIGLLKDSNIEINQDINSMLKDSLEMRNILGKMYSSTEKCTIFQLKSVPPY